MQLQQVAGRVSRPPRAPAPRRGLLLTLGAAAMVVGADAISKVVVVEYLAARTPVVLVPGVLDLTLTRNSGAAFSLAAGATVVFSAVAVLVAMAIISTARRLGSTRWAVALGLLLGGALGNLVDRLVRAPGFGRGHVVDWIHLHHWPVFNLADAAITIGGLLALLLCARGVELRGDRTQR